MMIHPLQKSEESNAKQVWKTCFGDSDTFIGQYFHSFVEYGKTLGYYENDRLLADLFMLPFCAKLGDREYEADFLAGCATLPEARRRGLMRELVKSAMLDMRRRGQCITYLHPFLHAFYRQFGYETIAYIHRRTVQGNRNDAKDVHVFANMQDVPYEDLFEAYNQYIARFDNAFIRSKKRFWGWLELLLADGGRCAVLENGYHDTYALYYVEDGAADVFELVYTDESQRDRLLRGLPQKTVHYFLPAEKDSGAEEFTMMRVLDPVQVLQGLDIKKERFVIEIADDFLGEKHHLSIERMGNGSNRVIPSNAKPDIVFSITEFARAAAGAFETDDIASCFFRRQTACFFETY